MEYLAYLFIAGFLNIIIQFFVINFYTVPIMLAVDGTILLCLFKQIIKDVVNKSSNRYKKQVLPFGNTC